MEWQTVKKKKPQSSSHPNLLYYIRSRDVNRALNEIYSPDFEYPKKGGYELMHVACWKGLSEVIDPFIEKGAGIE